MSQVWIADASPVISLGKVDQLGLLTALSPGLLLPPAVAEEIRAGRESDPARIWLDAAGARHISDPIDIDPRVLPWDLGPGETEAISLALGTRRATVLLDDRPARNCAKAHGLPVRGTLGVVILAKREGLLTRCGAVFEALVRAGIRVDGATLKQALELAGERASEGE